MARTSTTWEKGQSGNPSGRPPRDWTMTSLIREALEEEDETGVSYKKLISQKLVKRAASGDLQAIKEINNRLDGLPNKSIELTGDGLPVPILSGLSTEADGRLVIVLNKGDSDWKMPSAPIDYSSSNTEESSESIS